MSASRIRFRTGKARKPWAFSPFQYRVEQDDRRGLSRLDPSSVLVEDREQLDQARQVVSEFVGADDVAEAAVCLCMLRNSHPGRRIKRSEVLAALKRLRLA